MATGKRFYWIKLKETFMNSDAVDFLMSQKDGANYVVLYLTLCLKTINTNGRLSCQIGEVIIPYDEAKIARDCKWFSIDTIRVALSLYKSLGLVYIDNDGSLVIAQHDEMVGSETDYAEQKRRQISAKNKQILLGMESNVENFHTDIEIRNKEIEKDINKEQEEKENNKEKDDVVDEGLSRVIKLYEQIISNFPTSRATDLLKGYTEELGADVVCHAIEIAADNNVRKWAYIEKILQDYSHNHFTTLDQVKLSEQLREEERRRMQSGNAGRNYSSNGGTTQPKKDFSQYNLDGDLF